MLIPSFFIFLPSTPFKMKPFFLLLLLLLLPICFIIPSPASSVFAAGSSYQNCSRELIRCGSEHTNIGYPFWGMNRPDYCGYPGFHLNCADDSQLELTIMSQTYRVVTTDDDSQTVTVARADYTENLCPSLLSNNTLNTTIFREISAETANITLYYDCSPLTFTSNSYFNSFTCSNINGSNDLLLNYYTTLNRGNLGQFLAAVSRCQDTVALQAERTLVENLGNSISFNTDNLMRTLGSGFPLRWSADNSLCEDCRDSGGECGHNVSSGGFRCFCREGDGVNVNNTTTCPSGDDGSGNQTLPIALGIGGGGIALLLLIVLLVICVIKQRKRNAVGSRNSNDLSLPTTKPPPAPSLHRNQRTYSNLYPKSAIETGSFYFGTQVFSYSDLAAATDNFNPSKELGDGGFGAVYFGILGDGREVAVKRLYEKNFKRVEQFMNEVEILTRLHHPNLVRLYGCTSRHSKELILVYEYIANGTVADHLHGNRSRSNFLTWPIRLSIAIETASALLYLHMSDIIHRDVKTTNILLDSYFHVKVADFGLSRSLPTDVTHVSTAPQGTPGYVDPDYYRCFKLTDKSDVYSFGVVLVELLSGKEAVDTNRHRDDVSLANMAINKIQNHALHELVDPSLGFETDYNTRRMVTSVSELAFRCLQQDRDTRPAMEEVMETLKDIQNIELSSRMKAEEMDIRSADDVGLLKQISPPSSPDTVATDNVMQLRTV